MSGPQEWRKSAACHGEPTETFFPDGRGQSPYREARAICADCPVSDECLDETLSFEWGTSIVVRHGMTAGLTPQERIEVEKAWRALGMEPSRIHEVPSMADVISL